MALEPTMACVCDVCGHKWLSLGEAPPSRCAKCKTPKWNRPDARGKRKEEPTYERDEYSQA